MVVRGQMADVAGTTVLVTGAAQGMGRLYAGRAVAEGAARLILWDVDAAGLEAARAALQSAADRRPGASGATVVEAQAVDLADGAALAAAAARVAERGVPDVLINNAGIVRGAYFWEHTRADIDATMAVNALAPMRTTLAFLPAMIAAGRPARIVTVASAAGLVSNPRMSVYAASKAAALGWSDSLRLELEQAGHRHVKVTTVCPTYVSTGMFAGARGMLMTPLMTPEHVVEVVWASMLEGRPLLLMPWTVKLAQFARGALPRPAWDFLAGRVFGIYSSMGGFTGRPGAR